MKKQFAIFLAAVLAFSAVALMAADFWDETPYSQWNDKQVKKVLNDSPWAERIIIQGGGGGGGRGGGGGGRGGGGGGSGANMSAPNQSAVYLRWYSALPIREAYVKARFGDNADSDEAKAALQYNDPRYLLMVEGLPRNMVRGNADDLKPDITLKARGGDDVHPNEIQVQRNEETGEVTLLLLFPKADQGGRDFTVDNRQVEVDMKIGGQRILRRFNLRNMDYNGKLEL